jgi:hypothetical protein
MSGKYFCYDCQVVVPAIQPSARRGLTCLYCLREAVEKVSNVHSDKSRQRKKKVKKNVYHIYRLVKKKIVGMKMLLER